MTFPDTTFVSKSTVITAPWLQAVNDFLVGLGKTGRKSVLDFIPEAQHAAILAYTSTYDATADFNAALAAYPVIHVPAGGYLVTRPINLSARRTAFAFWGRRLIGDGANVTQINAYTGVYPCIDATGQNNGSIEGINFRSDNPPSGFTGVNCASIGLKMGRGVVSTGCNQLYLRDLRFNLTSDMARNAGNGTVGICNHAAEHIIADGIQIFANLPLASHNTMQFAVAVSSDIPTYGVDYEQPIVGQVSNTVHEWRNMQLIAYDSFRAIWFDQVGSCSMPNLYTSTRRLVSALPAQKETIYLTRSCSHIFIDCYQEVSGQFGAVFRMDHRYLTYSGLNQNINLTIQRGALDFNFTIPATPEPSIMALDGSLLANSKINCNYFIGIYQNSGDNNGFAALPVAITGTPLGFQNVELTLDSAAPRSADIWSVIGQYCTNISYQNYRSAATQRCDSVGGAGNIWLPVAIGNTTPGVGTYTFRSGKFERQGGWCHFTAVLVWSAHTGTGGLVITGLPFTSDVDQNQIVPVYFDTLTVDAGVYQAVGWIPNNSTQIQIRKCSTAGFAALGVQVDATVAEITVTGTYKIAN